MKENEDKQSGRARVREILAKLTVDWEQSQTSTVIDQALDSIEEVMKSVIGEDDVIKARQIGERSLMAVTRNQLRSQQLGRWESK